MRIKKTVLPVLAMALTTQALAPMMLPSLSHAADAAATTEARGELAAMTEAQRLNLNLLIATVVVDQKMGGLVEVDEAVARKYQLIKAAYLGSVPTTSVGGSAVALGEQSSKKVEFLIAPLTALLRFSGRQLVSSGRALDTFSRVTGLDTVITKGLELSEKSVEQVVLPILKVFVTKRTALSSATSSASAVFGGSVFFMMNDAKEAMTWERARQVLGQNDVVRARVESIVTEMAYIFNLDPSAQATLKIAIYDEAMKQAVANKFSQDKSKYSLDVVEIMRTKSLITSETASAVVALRGLTQNIQTPAQAGTRGITIENLDMAMNLAAVLESQLNSGRLQDPRLRGEVERMLGSLVAKLGLISFNMKKK